MGATNCCLLSYYFGGSLVNRFLKSRVEDLRKKVFLNESVSLDNFWCADQVESRSLVQLSIVSADFARSTKLDSQFISRAFEGM